MPAFINSINNVERIGDHAVDIGKFAQTKIDNGYGFSEPTFKELTHLKEVVGQMFDNTLAVLQDHDITRVEATMALENEVDVLCRQYMANHNKRLEEGSCKIEGGVMFVDIINHIERIADHLYKLNLIARDTMGILKH